MIRMFRFYIDMCLLKATPQDVPSSTNIYILSVMAYFLVGAFILSLAQTVITSLILSGIQTAMLMFLTNLILWIKKTPERYNQTMTALAITGAMIGFIAYPMMSVFTAMGADIDILTSVAGLILLLWETLVIAHVLRHAMDLSFAAGLAGSFVYMYLSFAITMRILKVMSISVG